MKPLKRKAKIFLDGGDPNEAKDIINALGFLDGQTTNPTLISKNNYVTERLSHGEKFSEKEIIEFYRKVVKEASQFIPKGSVSVEVYADVSTTAKQMLAQGREMFSWIPNAHIKFPITKEGLIAAHQAVKEGMRVNMTLCFTQEQAAAVYSATKGAAKGDVYLSPFVGRLDDRGEDGMSFVANILKMYEKGDGHVEVLTASVRNLEHFLYALSLGSDIITAPYKVLKEWGATYIQLQEKNYTYIPKGLKKILYKEIDIHKEWRNFDISHDLTKQGIERFSDDWNRLIKK